MAARLSLAHLPTPLIHLFALDALVGTEVWVKRDDATGGAEAGNKARKLEFLLADALEQGATTVITCGGIQSNHARATALLAARLGLRSTLLLRTVDGRAPGTVEGNVLLDRLVGARLRFITPEEYRSRDELMLSVAEELGRAGERAYVIPEGGSNGLGALGYVEACRELRAQLDQGIAGSVRSFDLLVHACGSGGTAAGCVLGAAQYDISPRVLAVAVCDDRAYFEETVARIIREARVLQPELDRAAELEVMDEHKGPAYGVMSDEQLRFLVAVARTSGLTLDPVYSGKALFGLARSTPKPRRVLFIHTGGLPGLLAQAGELTAAVGGTG